jgi:hypothetical protein
VLSNEKKNFYLKQSSLNFLFSEMTAEGAELRNGPGFMELKI